MYRLLIVVIIGSLFFSCKSNENKINYELQKQNYEECLELSHGLANLLDTVKIYSKVTPILRDKEENIVVSWEFRVNNIIVPIFLKGLKFNLKGTENLKDFEAFTMEYQNEVDSVSVFGETLKLGVDSLLVFKDKVKLKKGSNVFRLKCKLAKNADIHNHLVLKPISMIISGKEYKVAVNSLQRKFGIALLKHGQNNVNTYRMPAITTTKKGTLIAVYDMRHESAKGLQGDIDVGMSRSQDGGQTWKESNVIVDMGEYGNLPENENGVSNPAILYDEKKNTLWVEVLWRHGLASYKGMFEKLLLVKSTNDGKTWSEPKDVISYIKNANYKYFIPCSGKGVAFENKLIFPVQFKNIIDIDTLGNTAEIDFTSIIYSKNNGRSWHLGKEAVPNTSEGQVIALDDENLLINAYKVSNDEEQKDKRIWTQSSDFGEKWTKFATENLSYSKNIGLLKEEFVVNGKKQSLVLCSSLKMYANVPKITIQVSLDNGKTWNTNTLIDAGTKRGRSSMTKIDDKHLGILYEGSGADLVFEVFDIDELVKE
ncbi:MAG: exo-alpha-sialidase [Flavobacteriaceae bacterium]|nr:exo-alpha-sialidase [Flavobacteriaceae bacterium]